MVVQTLHPRVNWGVVALSAAWCLCAALARLDAPELDSPIALKTVPVQQEATAPPVHTDGSVSFEYALDQLTAMLPAGRVVAVKIVPIKHEGYWGRTYTLGNLSIVEIEETACLPMRIEILVHEWGHVLDPSRTGSCHGPSWGVYYARIHRHLWG